MIHALTLLSIISVFFGILIFLEPQIIAYLVGGFFVLSGIIGFFFSLQAKTFWQNINKK
jgi:uncharacterized membrane protein HdeD (DUF308 family)